MTEPRHLPIATKFCFAHVPLDLYLDDGTAIEFFIDGNSKITAGNGTYAEPVPNAFSLPAASVDGPAASALPACPGSTSVCRSSCYVKGLAKHDPALYASYSANARALEYLFAAGPGFVEYGAHVLATWIRACAPHGFRWHVSGDVTSMEHALFIAETCERAPEVPFWIYTRTFDLVPYMASPNLAINVSADRENFEAAAKVAYEYGARICYLSDDGNVPPLPPGSVIFPDYSLRGRGLADPTSAPWWQGLTHEERAMTCPTDFFGQSEAHRCGPCRKCLDR